MAILRVSYNKILHHNKNICEFVYVRVLILIMDQNKMPKEIRQSTMVMQP